MEASDVYAWIEAGFAHPKQAGMWAWTGVAPQSTSLLEAQDISAPEAAGWHELGLSDKDILPWHEMGLRPEHLEILRPKKRRPPSVERISALTATGLSALEAVQLLIASDVSKFNIETLIQLWMRISLQPDGWRRTEARRDFIDACLRRVPLEWLEYFTDPSDSRRLSYLNTRVPPSWYEAGVPLYIAEPAIARHWNLEEVEHRLKIAQDYGEPDTWEAVEKAHLIRPEDLARAAALSTSDLPPAWIALARRCEVDLATIAAAAQSGLPIGVVEWHYRVGTYDPTQMRRWCEVGVRGHVAHQFEALGLDPEASLAWLQAGFLPSEVKEYLKRGGTPDTAQNPCYVKNWREAFSRSRGKQEPVHFFIRDTELGDRVRDVIDYLEVRRGGHSMMYSSLVEEASFLDGGWRSEDGYGFGAVHGEWIVGFHAFRFVCHRIGVHDPRRLTGEEEVPSLESLEAHFSEMLRSIWASTSQ